MCLCFVKWVQTVQSTDKVNSKLICTFLAHHLGTTRWGDCCTMWTCEYHYESVAPTPPRTQILHSLPRGTGSQADAEPGAADVVAGDGPLPAPGWGLGLLLAHLLPHLQEPAAAPTNHEHWSAQYTWWMHGVGWRRAERMNGWLDRWLDVWIVDEWMNEQMMN